MTTQARIAGIPGQNGSRLAKRLLRKSDEVRNWVGRTTISTPRPVRVLILPRRCRKPKSPRCHLPNPSLVLTAFFVVKTVYQLLQDARMKRRIPPINQFSPISILPPVYSVARYQPFAMVSMREGSSADLSQHLFSPAPIQIGLGFHARNLRARLAS